jgi:hypothetical protein
VPAKDGAYRNLGHSNFQREILIPRPGKNGFVDTTILYRVPDVAKIKTKQKL